MDFDGEELTPENVEQAFDSLDGGNWHHCGRRSIYSARLGAGEREVTYVCGGHSAWFFDHELELYDGDEGCLAIVID